MKEYHITCSTDDNYVQHCMAMLCSLFENNAGYIFHVHLLHHALSKHGQQLITALCQRYSCAISFYDIDEQYTSEFKISASHPNLSVATYYRIFLPSLLTADIERILYLDCDIIVLGKVIDLYELELDNYGVAATCDGTPLNDQHRQILSIGLGDKGFCAGVLMINLAYWREHDSSNHMLEYINRMGDNLMMEDQDVLNHEFRHHWLQLPYKYGKYPMTLGLLDSRQKAFDFYEYAMMPCILHYASSFKPWLNVKIPDGKHYWKYVALSGFPNPKATKIDARENLKLRILILRYYLNCYVRPFIPNILELIVKDIAALLMIPFYFLKRDGMKRYRLKRWLEKYGV